MVNQNLHKLLCIPRLSFSITTHIDICHAISRMYSLLIPTVAIYIFLVQRTGIARILFGHSGDCEIHCIFDIRPQTLAEILATYIPGHYDCDVSIFYFFLISNTVNVLTIG